MSIGQPRPSVQNDTLSGSLNAARSASAIWSIVMYWLSTSRGLLAGRSRQGCLRPWPKASTSSVTTTSATFGISTSTGGNSW